MSGAQSPAQAAEDVVALVSGPVNHAFYGELVQHRRLVPWRAAYARSDE
jgi:hypothetical protein